MEIPIINSIIDFETNINPPVVSQLSAASGIGKFYQTYNLWKWGALILALIASFTTIIHRVKLLVIKLRKHPSQSPSQYHLLDDDDYESDTDSFSSDNADEDVDDEEEEEEEPEMMSFSTAQNRRQIDEDFRVRGSGHVYIDEEQWPNHNLGLTRRRRSIGDLFSLSELMTSGKNVVKLWDNLGWGLGLNMEEDSDNKFTIYDMNNEREIRKIDSIFVLKDEIPAIFSTSSSSAGGIVSAAMSDSSRVTLSSWDTRIGSRLPAILAEWRPKKLRNIVGSNALTVGDMRKVNSPLEDPTGSDMNTWWDAGAVILTED